MSVPHERPHPSVVAQECARRIDDLVRWLGLKPDDKRGGVFTPLNPTRGDRNPGSFVIYGQGHAKQGGWVEFATGDKGDAMDLAGYVRTGVARDRAEAYRQAMRFLGWGGADALDAPDQAARRAALMRDRQHAEERAAKDLAEHRKRAFAQWLKDQKLAPGSLAWVYLSEARGLDLTAMARLPNAIRTRAGFVRNDTGEIVPPAMACAITGPDETVWGVHRTFLADDGRGKAGVDPARKIWPAGFWGGAIRISRGASGLRPREAAAAGVKDVLAVTEGVEDALTIALAAPAWRVWSAAALVGMGRVELPDCVRAVVLVRDRDEERKRLAGDEKAATRAAEAWRGVIEAMAQRCHARGAELYQVAPKGDDKDFNDALRRMAGAL